MRLTLSRALAGLVLTLAGVSTSNAADLTVTLTTVTIVDLEGGGKGAKPSGTFNMNGQGLNQITIQAWNGTAWVDLNGPTGRIAGNTWQIPNGIPVTVGNTYKYRAVLHWTDNATGKRGTDVPSDPKEFTP